MKRYHIHYTAKAFLEVRHLYVAGRCDFTAPPDKPLASAFTDPETVALVEDLKAHPADRVTTRCLGPRQWDANKRTQDEEADDRLTVRRARGVKLIVISDEEMPRLGSVTR